MKIAPHSAPPARMPAEPTAAPGVGLSFEDMIQAPETLGRERAFGFSELGVLGARVTVREARAPLQRDTALHSNPACAAATSPGIATRGVEASSPHHVTAARGGAVSHAATSSVSQVLARPTNAPAVVAADAPTAELPPASDAESSALSRAAPSRRTPPASSKPLKLVVLERNGSLQLIAGSPDLSADERARLRRAAAAVAAEFGLAVECFTLNGSESEPPAFIPIGASHGHHRG